MIESEKLFALHLAISPTAISFSTHSGWVMEEKTRYRCASRRSWAGLFFALMVWGCGGEQAPPPPVASSAAAASSVQKNGARKNEPAAQAAPSPALEMSRATPIKTSELNRLRALPLLSALSDRDIAGLLKRLPGASPFHRLKLINSYSGLTGLPDQQKQVLADQLAMIVPVAIPANLLICQCAGDIQRKMCVHETCSDRPALQSLCNQACGTLAAFGTQCTASNACGK